MKLLFPSLAFAIVLLAACTDKSAYNFSEAVVKLERSIDSVVSQSERMVETFWAAQNFDSLSSVAKTTEGFIAGKVNELSKMEAPKGAEAADFKKEAVRWFSHYQSIYSAYIAIAAQTTEEGRNQELVKLENITKQSKDLLASLQESQKKFAAANKFKVQ